MVGPSYLLDRELTFTLLKEKTAVSGGLSAKTARLAIGFQGAHLQAVVLCTASDGHSLPQPPVLELTSVYNNLQNKNYCKFKTA